MRTYNQVLGNKHLAASKAYLDMTKPLENSGKSRRWARDVYNLVQRCVTDVQVAEKKMDKARLRVARAADELAHWKTVLAANEATYQVQPNNPEVKRAFQLAQYRFSNAFGEDEAAGAEYDDARTMLLGAIARRDEIVEEASELSQSVEEDRLDTLLIVIGQFVETKVAILQAEIEAMADLQRTLKAMDRDSVVQQYIVDSMAPELTHRHAKALSLMEWHRVSWRYEQQSREAAEPASYLAVAGEDIAKLKASGVSEKDVEVIKDFVSSCFVDPEEALLPSSSLTASGTAGPSSKHRSKFTDASASATQSMYRLSVVRRVILGCLTHQRAHDRELTREGYSRLSAALRLLLDACLAQHDTRTTKQLMNMLQTFYRKTSKDGQEYLHAALKDHAAWRVAAFWGDALLESVAEELSKTSMDTPWYFLADPERAQKVLELHNIVYGQVSAYLYHLSSFGFTRRQLLQFARNVCFAYELGEDQRISLLSSIQSMVLEPSQEDDYEEKREEPMGLEDGAWQRPSERDSEMSDRGSCRVPAARTADVPFTSFTLPDWSSFSSGGGISGAGTDGIVSKFGRGRGESTASNATTVMEGSTTASYVGSVRDLEEMKMIASTVVGGEGDESWENLFGASAASNSTAGDEPTPSILGIDDGGSEMSDKHKDKLMKRRKNSRKFNDQLRLARSIPLSLRIHEEEASATAPTAATAVSGKTEHKQQQPPLPPGPPPPSSVPILLRPRSTDNVFVAAREEAGELPPTHSSTFHTRTDYEIATDEYGSGRTAGSDKSERRRHRKLHKARSAASIDTSVLRAETEQVFNSSRSAASPATGMDQIKTIAARMKQRRKEHSGGNIDFVALTRAQSDATGSASPTPAATVGEPPTPEKKTTLSGVAALRARFENK
ncbi:unnamed protein product [Phytophthora lilii]|uniref:Unnamed protein product n=1 Tax=Phytophthora lilii TaxID=2077276 RepID=A0A9W6U3R6_9STRA|nr:unnamed protein product [Phytophthora lilii]